MKGKIFTPDEITRMLPLVRRIVMDVKACSTLIRRHERAIFEIELLAEQSSEAPSEDRIAEHREKIIALKEKAATCERELSELGGEVEDASRGIVKFYGERAARIVFYTWRLGEGRVEFWYPVDKTYGDRRSIDDGEPVAEAEARKS
ncbi:MAG: DUF2203 family protein [Planctomycetota bacterium]